MQNMRQVTDLFLCYGSMHKQPPLTASGEHSVPFPRPDTRIFVRLQTGHSAKPAGARAIGSHTAQQSSHTY